MQRGIPAMARSGGNTELTNKNVLVTYGYVIHA